MCTNWIWLSRCYLQPCAWIIELYAQCGRKVILPHFQMHNASSLSGTNGLTPRRRLFFLAIYIQTDTFPDVSASQVLMGKFIDKDLAQSKNSICQDFRYVGYLLPAPRPNRGGCSSVVPACSFAHSVVRNKTLHRLSTNTCWLNKISRYLQGRTATACSCRAERRRGCGVADSALKAY